MSQSPSSPLSPHGLNDNDFVFVAANPEEVLQLNTYIHDQAPLIRVSPSKVMPSNCPCGSQCQGGRCVMKLRSKPNQGLTAGGIGRSSSRSSTPSSYGSLESTDVLIQENRELSPSGRSATESPSLEETIRCECHVKVEDKAATKKARNKLIIACLIALFFMIGEVIGGYLSNSLAILTDAAHMLSDFASFLISLFAIWVATRAPSSRFSFGWHRAEVVGAVVSVLIIWVLTGVLVYEAVLRSIHQDYDIDADIMLITACVGVFVNVFMCMVLGHSHGHGHGHGHGHEGGRGHEHDEGVEERLIEEDSEDKQASLSVADPHSNSEGERSVADRLLRRKKRKHAEHRNINVRAAFIHVIGDLIQSIGVVIAGYIVWFTGWKLADPICTFLFSILVLFSTLNVLKDALGVLMEGTPKHIDYEDVRDALQELEGVKHAHSLHIWSLTLNKTALSAHLALEAGANNQVVLDSASRMLRQKYSIQQTTIQVEEWKEEMGDCGTCQNTGPKKRMSFCWS